MNERKLIVWFLVIAFGVSWPLFLLPMAFGAPRSKVRQIVSTVAWAAAMWGPGLAAILVTHFLAGWRLSTLNLGRLRPEEHSTWRPYLWGWLLPPALAVVTGMLTLALGAGQLDLEFTAVQEAMARVPGGEVVPAEIVMAILIIFSLTLAPLFNCIFSLGEELGWRGFLLPCLLPLGRGKAILLSSAIWGIWHAPAILQGYNQPSRPMLGVFMMVIFCLLMGIVFSWLYLRTKSPWAPTLAHASLNSTAGLPMLFLADVDMTIGGTTASPIGWIGLAAFVGWLILSRRPFED